MAKKFNKARFTRKLSKGKLLENLVNENQRGLDRIMLNSANRVVEDARSSMALSPPIGARYGGHIASAPYNPPRIQEGDLEKAVQVKVEPLRVGVFAESGQADKAVWMEYGTSEIEPRPFLLPAIVREKKNLHRSILNSLIRRAKKAKL